MPFKWLPKVGRSFRFRLTIGLSAIILLIMGIGAVVMIYETEEAIRVSAETRGLAFSRSFAMIGGQAVLENLFLIQEALGQHMKNPDITEIDVIDTDDMIVAAKHPERIGLVLSDEDWRAARSRESESLEYRQDAQGKPTLVIMEPLSDQGKITAWIRVVFSLKNIRQEALVTMGRMVILTLALVATGIFSVRFALRRMAHLLRQIVGQLQEALRSLGVVANPEYESKASTTPEDELEHLAEVATSTTDLLKNQSNSLRALTVSLDEKVRERTAELDRQRQKAEEASRLKSAFLANLNHELRTPLNGLLGMVSVLSEGPSFSNQHPEQIQILRSCANSLKDLISDVLELSKIEAGKVELATVPLDVRSIIEQTMNILAVQAAEKGTELICRVGRALPRAVKGDPNRLQEILLNLTGNALKFTRNGEVEVHADLMEESMYSLLVRFSVHDSGIGIPKDKQEIIFEPFTQIADSPDGRREGIGLGLSICKRLVELMGGQMGVESELGLGSTFWFTVRFKPCEAAVPPSAPVLQGLRGIKVLILDDNAASRGMLVETLEAEGALCLTASDGETGLLSFRKSLSVNDPFGLVLLDDAMPGFEAERMVEAIRTEGGSGSVPVILMTSVKSPREAQWLLAKGFTAGLTKPVRSSQLLELIHSVLRQSPTGIEPQADTPAPAVPRRSEERAQVLLVEDNETNQKVIRWFLQETSYRLDTVATGQDALRALEHQCYDILLLDLRLPDMDGMKVAEMIRRDSRWADLPILALTAAALPEDLERCAAVGLNGYLVKPLDGNAVLSAIENALASTRN